MPSFSALIYLLIIVTILIKSSSSKSLPLWPIKNGKHARAPKVVYVQSPPQVVHNHVINENVNTVEVVVHVHTTNNKVINLNQPVAKSNGYARAQPQSKRRITNRNKNY
ncbi:unnamed protein product [Oppiella nova]|uniref:Uncharacterized protein n=1 Tax=Oppiella nova TaxID=334625 RepID=A0A7R9QT44_9ACAR|nr:unnamed protein product [Oppiella nova]CAG2173403.1 unnamed protein product [Oppiella nova]